MPGAREAYLLLERLRWGGAPDRCPHCGAPGPCYFLRPAAGSGRRTRTGAPTERRVWKCGRCRRQFSVLTGTVLEGTRVPLPAWLEAIRALADGAVPHPHGVSPEAARGLARRLSAALEHPTARAAAGSAEGLLAALLRIPAADAARIRQATPGRVRPRRQVGPSAAYGGR